MKSLRNKKLYGLFHVLSLCGALVFALAACSPDTRGTAQPGHQPLSATEPVTTAPGPKPPPGATVTTKSVPWPSKTRTIPSPSAVPETTPGGGDRSKGLVISLPFATADTPYEMMPMGETINHPDGGHPGIDFMWDKSVDIIACADGTVVLVEKTVGHGKWDVYVQTDDVIIGYTTLETVDERVKVGSKIAAGEKIGQSGLFGHSMIHWELERELRGTRFCPMAYLDETSRQRLLDIWGKTKWPEMKGPFPHICNGSYRCDYCLDNGY